MRRPDRNRSARQQLSRLFSCLPCCSNPPCFFDERRLLGVRRPGGALARCDWSQLHSYQRLLIQRITSEYVAAPSRRWPKRRQGGALQGGALSATKKMSRTC